MHFLAEGVVNRLVVLGVLSAFILTRPIEAAPASGAAGVVQRAVEQEFKVEDISPEKEVPLLEIDIPTEVLDIPTGIAVHIESIILQGNTVLSEKEIKRLLDPYCHRELNGKDVIQLCQEIDQFYVKKGYFLAWTYPPVQKIENGQLILQVLEGHLADIEIEGNISYSTNYIRKYVSHLKGKALNYNDLLKALILLNENFSLTVKGVLRKSPVLGGVCLVLVIQDKFPYQFSVGYNNWGSQSTTYDQISSEADVGNVLASGDKLVLLTSFGIPPVFYFVNPIYSIPVNGYGSRLSFSYLYSFSNIQQLQSLELKARSEVGTIALSQPVARTRKFSATTFAIFDIKQMSNYEQGETVSFDKLRVFSFGAALDYVDAVLGRSFFNAYLRAGIPDFLGGYKAVDPSSSREGSGARYYILDANFQRIQPLPKDCSLLLTTSAQGTFNLLPIPEEFAIGGIGSVRGYPAAVAIGDLGYFGNLEFYTPLPFLRDTICKSMKKKWKEFLQFLVFLDHGGVYSNNSVEDVLSPAYLTSTGVGLRFYGPRGVNVSFDAAFPLTNQYKDFSRFYYIRVNASLF